MTTVTYTLGTKTGSTTITHAKAWSCEGKERVYFTCVNSKGFSGLNTLYHAVSGGTGSDLSVEVNGCLFGFTGFFDSKTKRAAATEAVTELATMLLSVL